MARTLFNGPVASQNGFLVGTADTVDVDTPGVYSGAGAPVFAAAQGSLYLRTDGNSTSTRAYINTDGATAWTAITTAT